MPPADASSPHRQHDPAVDRGLAVWVGVLVAAVMLLVSSGTITGSDGPAMYHVTRSIVEDGDLTTPQRLGFPGRDGNHYASHGLGLPLVAVGPYLLARPLARLTSESTEVSEAAVSSVMPVIAGLLAAALYLLARRLGGGTGSSVLVSLGAMTGTFLLPYLKDFYSEPLATLLVAVAIERALADRPGLSGLGLAAAGVTRPQAFALAPMLVWRVWREAGGAGAARAGLPVLGGVALALAYNAARFGNPLRFDPLQSSIDVWPGAAEATGGLLFLPTKSVLLFAPIVILVVPALWALRRSQPTAFWLLGGNLVLTVAVAVLWPAWDGGWTWGPRLLLPGLIPAAAAVAPWMGGSPWRRRSVVALLLLGLLVSLPGVLVSTRAQLLRDPPARGPSVTRQYALLPGSARFTVEHLYGSRDPRRYIDTWQVGLARTAGRPGLLAAAGLSLCLLTVAGISASQVVRRLRVPTSHPVGSEKPLPSTRDSDGGRA